MRPKINHCETQKPRVLYVFLNKKINKGCGKTQIYNIIHRKNGQIYQSNAAQGSRNEPFHIYF